MDEKEIIKNLYREMYYGMIKKDRSILERVLDDSFVLVHMTAMRQAKEAFITAIESGTLNYYSENPVNIEVTITGNTASLIGQSEVSAAVFGGGRHTWRLEQDIELTKRDGKWRMTRSVAGMF